MHMGHSSCCGHSQFFRGSSFRLRAASMALSFCSRVGSPPIPRVLLPPLIVPLDFVFPFDFFLPFPMANNCTRRELRLQNMLSSTGETKFPHLGFHLLSQSITPKVRSFFLSFLRKSSQPKVWVYALQINMHVTCMQNCLSPSIIRRTKIPCSSHGKIDFEFGVKLL